MMLRAAFAPRAVGAAALLVSAACLAADAQTGGPYVPTPPVVVDAMLELARVGPRDFVIDLGSGDGRIVIAAAQKYRARGLGVDIDPELVNRANAAARSLGLADRVQFRRQDVLETDVSRATVLTLYLLPAMMENLRPKFLKELRPGTRIVSHDFGLGEWKPDRTITVETPVKYDLTGSYTSDVHLWIVPARFAGQWRGTLSAPPGEPLPLRFEVRQSYQFFDGRIVREGREERIAGSLEGTRLRFTVVATKEVFTGRIEGEGASGEVRSRDGALRARWSASRVP
jgi:protein-L-isoaspartate O-methyltransferase